MWVGRKSPNGWGLYDVHGNVAEWCSDYYAGYLGGDEIDPAGPTVGNHHVIRGCSFEDEAEFCRAAFRRIEWVEDRSIDIGFRVVAAPVYGSLPGAPIQMVTIPAGRFLMGSTPNPNAFDDFGPVPLPSFGYRVSSAFSHRDVKITFPCFEVEGASRDPVSLCESSIERF